MAMLTVDTSLPDCELRTVIARECAKYGIVKHIRIVRQQRPPRCFVEMSTIPETQALLSAIADSPFGIGAVIELRTPSPH
jgi:hypothetical protein